MKTIWKIIGIGIVTFAVILVSGFVGYSIGMVQGVWAGENIAIDKISKVLNEKDCFHESDLEKEFF